MKAEGESWLLARIKGMDLLKDPPTQKNIFRGCYDVWHCDQDRLDSVEIPKLRLEQVREMGLIELFPNPKNSAWPPCWRLTEAGEKYLAEHPY